MSSLRRPTLTIAVFVLVFAALAFAGPARRGEAQSPNEGDISDSLRTFSELYGLVEQNFADKVDPDTTLYEGAIPGMLQTLDPHSSFLDPKYFQLLREEQQGHYYGVGMLVGMRENRVVVMHPFTNSPAHKAGIRPGDAIAAIDGEAAKNFSTSEVADRLKGPRGTKVLVTVDREGSKQPLTFTMFRDEISRKSVENAQLLHPGIGYVKIDAFNENTGDELDESLKNLGEDNLEGLILDLRGNPGGLLNEGVAVANHFLKKGQTIVSHHGRASSEQSYVAKGNGKANYPVVVLVDRYSASAAEIVAGALQDHDRAWILGDNTFGKGLVQSQYPLSGQTALLLTTAKYYTPSGRLIQRDYAHTAFVDYYNHRGPASKNPKDVKRTDSGRTVYGGGGIAPDEKYTGLTLNNAQQILLAREAFFEFVAEYLAGHPVEKSPDWHPTAEVLNEFRKFTAERGIRLTEGEFQDNLPWIKQRIEDQMHLVAFGKDDADRLAVPSDPMVLYATQSLPKAKALLQTSKHLLAQRAEK